MVSLGPFVSGEMNTIEPIQQGQFAARVAHPFDHHQPHQVRCVLRHMQLAGDLPNRLLVPVVGKADLPDGRPVRQLPWFSPSSGVPKRMDEVPKVGQYSTPITPKVELFLRAD